MKISGESLAQKAFDLCVVGSGPGGMIVALEHSRRNPEATVLLVEYGAPGDPPENALDRTIRIENPINHHPPEECTNKGLGGTSATWGGRCVSYDEIDFLDRPILGGECTWGPEFFAAVRPHYGRAAEYFECGSGPFDLNGIPEFAGRRIAGHFVPGEVTDSALERWSLPTRFGPRYRAEVEASPNLFLATGWEARTLDVPDDEGHVGGLELRSVGTGELRRVRARAIVLAAGTQETTRVLLRNPQVFRALGGPPPALGRYYQSHVSGKIATVRFAGDPRSTDFGFLRDGEGIYLRRRLQLATSTLLAHNLLNTALWLDNPLYFDPAHRSGAMSFMYLAMITPVLGPRLAPPAIAQSVTKGKVNRVGAHVANVLRGLPGSLATPASIFFRRYCLRRKLPGVFLYSPQNRYALHFHAEQVPDARNRMELGPDGETLIIHYDLVDADVDSVLRTHAVLDDFLRATGAGELEYWHPEAERSAAIRAMSRDGIHQSGTTRIADSPERGVLDSDLRVWGTRNLFVCSSSAFPTSSQANPTFFLGACAVRLAHHLESHALR